jgi:hypothetical protein
MMMITTPTHDHLSESERLISIRLTARGSLI